MCRFCYDANLKPIVAQARLKSSFIYLANAVNDLSGNWISLTLVLAPLVLLASFCLLPDALNLQHRFAQSWEAGTHSVSVAYHPVSLREIQEPYKPEMNPTSESRDPYPRWVIVSLHLVFLLLALFVQLVVLCALERVHGQMTAGDPLSEAVEVYRRAVPLAPPFLWIALLMALAEIFGAVLLVLPGILIYFWLRFSQYALVFENTRSWHALLRSRDLLRGRLWKVAVRITVFLAVWSGYNAWTSTTFFVSSVLLGPVAAVTGYVWGTVFALDLLAVGVGFATTAFFTAAGVRLYQDLVAEPTGRVVPLQGPASQSTAPLATATG